MIPTRVVFHMEFPEDQIGVYKAEVEAWRWRRPPPHRFDGETAANYSWHFLWWHFSTFSLLNGISRPPPHCHPSTTNTHINPPLYSCDNSTAEIAASCLHLIDPLSRCWIWSNHSQSSLNISFFKQNRGSKFHHSMTRSVADNTIKPIPAYPEGAISGGTAGRWEYRPTERCQSPLIHSSLWTTYTAQHLGVGGGLLTFPRISNRQKSIFFKRSDPLSKISNLQ